MTWPSFLAGSDGYGKNIRKEESPSTKSGAVGITLQTRNVPMEGNTIHFRKPFIS